MDKQQPIAKQGISEPYKAPRPHFLPVYKNRGDSGSGLLFMFDPGRGVVSIAQRGTKYTVDLGAEIVAYFEKQKDVPA